MHKKIKIFVSSDEFTLIDEILCWYCEFFETDKSHDIIALKVANQLINKLYKYAYSKHIILTNSELYYLVNACEYAYIEKANKYEGLVELIEKLKGYNE